MAGREYTTEDLNGFGDDQEMVENIQIMLRTLDFEPEIQQSRFFLHDGDGQPKNKDTNGMNASASSTTSCSGARLKLVWDYMPEANLGPKITETGEEEQKEYTLFNESRHPFGPQLIGARPMNCNFNMPVKPVKPVPIKATEMPYRNSYFEEMDFLPAPHMSPVGSGRHSSRASTPLDGLRKAEEGAGKTSTLSGMSDFVARYNLGFAQPRAGLQSQMRSHKYVNDFGGGGVYLQRRSNGNGSAPQRRLF